MFKLLSAALLGLCLFNAAPARADLVIVVPTPHRVHHRRHRHFRVYRDERGFEHRHYYD
jgi:hypothetical protein